MTEDNKIRKFGIIGIASPIIGLLAVLVSISISPWFDWPINSLSDLGVEQQGGTQIAIWIFNGGMKQNIQWGKGKKNHTIFF